VNVPEDPKESQESPKIRLPELAIFKKYSIALRKEFAEAEEFDSVLEKTLTQLNALKRGGATPTRLSAGRTGSRPEHETAQEQDLAPDQVSTTVSRPEHETAQEQDLAPALDDEAADGADEVAAADAAFWEMAPPDAPKSPRKLAPKRKPKPPPTVVRVSSSGQPIIESSPSSNESSSNKRRAKK